ncbi:MAG: hypothetical protein AAGF93_18975 [Cyanobacteria bacterium P01_H01_bin.105]
MAGFFGLFGGKNNQAPQSKEAYFLSEDDAKSFGDIDFMRKEVVVRRTFAKKKGQAEELESVKSISSSSAKSIEEIPGAVTSFSSFSAPKMSAPSEAEAETGAETEATSTTTSSSFQEPVIRRGPDTSMDMFRNMAKKIRK